MEESSGESARFSGLLPDVLRMPATGLTCLAAIGVTLIVWITEEQSAVAIDTRGFLVLPWTPITSALVHVDVLHLLFNLAWLWRFGGWLEHRIGSLRTLLVYAFLAIGSAAAEFAWNFGGVGLSGVVYGLFACLWVRGRVDRDVVSVLDRYTVMLFVLWFFCCIALTVSNVYPVGNAAHLVGALAGAGIGWVWNREGMRRRVAVVVLCTGFVLVLEAATVGRFLVNTGPGLAFAHAQRAHDAVERRDFAAALTHGQLAVEIDPKNGYARWYLGCSQVMTGRELDGLVSFREADRLGTRTLSPEAAWSEWMDQRMFEFAAKEDWTNVSRLANEVLHENPVSARAWSWVGHCETNVSRFKDACSAFERAFELDPDSVDVREDWIWAKLTRSRTAFEAHDHERAYREIQDGIAVAPEDERLTAARRSLGQALGHER